MPRGKKKEKLQGSLFCATPYENNKISAADKVKWEQFKEYCKQDVESERAIIKRLAKYSSNSTERRLWVLDQTINNNGVWIDMELVRGAMRVDELIKSEAMKAGEGIFTTRRVNTAGFRIFPLKRYSIENKRSEI